MVPVKATALAKKMRPADCMNHDDAVLLGAAPKYNARSTRWHPRMPKENSRTNFLRIPFWFIVSVPYSRVCQSRARTRVRQLIE